MLKEEKLEQRIEQLTRELEAERTRPTRTKSKETDTQTSDEKKDGSSEGESGEDTSSVTGSVPKPVAREDKVPKISLFSGAVVKDDDETIEDWLDQFDLIASVFNWDEPMRLMYLVTHLKGNALAFYRSCSN